MRYSKYVEAMQAMNAVDSAWAIHGEARRRQREGEEDLLVLSIGDHDFSTDDQIVDAAVDSLRSGRHHYSGNVGMLETRQAAAEYYTRTIGETVDLENIAIVPGAQCGVFASYQVTLDAGDEIIVFDPMYVTYEGAILSRHAKLVRVPLRPENGYQPDPDDVRAAVTPRTRAIMLNSPNNPMGSVVSREGMEALAAICIEHDLWMISDEVYATLTFKSQHVSPRLIDGMAERTLSVHSLSKSHGMTGWRLGWVVGPKPAIQAIGDVLGSLMFGTAMFIQDAAQTALTAASDRVTANIRETYRHRRDVICEALSGVPRIRFFEPEAGMFLMVDVRDTGLGSMEFGRKLLDEQKLAILPGEGFGPSLSGQLRLSYCVEEDQLREAARRIAAFVQRHAKAA
ncbi:MAG: pyridoxal phosphate-dependent aminotransferase [Rhodospirillaceae bacterium]|jgi:arginine:pyruvate transaminase|nr:pyridoxal phosphate-dependent aminotransferase [Rhodospirillaceae bacterium]MBT6139564.1 pyridoxal phosphate-dependent aminotransferase [Rhodospirillaceae bacterium]